MRNRLSIFESSSIRVKFRLLTRHVELAICARVHVLCKSTPHAVSLLVRAEVLSHICWKQPRTRQQETARCEITRCLRFSDSIFTPIDTTKGLYYRRSTRHFHSHWLHQCLRGVSQVFNRCSQVFIGVSQVLHSIPHLEECDTKGTRTRYLK